MPRGVIFKTPPSRDTPFWHDFYDTWDVAVLKSYYDNLKAK